MHNTGLSASGSVSILVRNNIPQSKINLNTKLQAITVKATMHIEINVCSLYIAPDNAINNSMLNILVAQLPKLFIIWEVKKQTKNAKYFKKVINSNNLCLFNNGSQIYLNLLTSYYSIRDLTVTLIPRKYI